MSCGLAAAAPANSLIVLDAKAVTWSVDGKDTPIRTVAAPIAEGQIVAGLRITTDDEGRLVAIREADQHEAWRIAGTEPRAVIAPLHFTDHEVFFQRWRESGKGADRTYRIAEPSLLRWAAVDSGEELPALVMPEDTEPNERVAVVGIADDLIYAVSEVPARSDNDMYERVLKHSRVMLWPRRGGKTLWHATIPYQRAASPAAGLLGGGGPAYAATGLCLANSGGGSLFVCTGPHDALWAFDLKTGKLLWKQPAVWEYQRGFIGPSVWSHFISRFGRDPFDHDAEKEDEPETSATTETPPTPAKRGTSTKNPQAKKPPEKADHQARLKAELASNCRIIGGPMYVGSGDIGSVFVAVSEGAGPFGGFVSSCRIYEISAKTGAPVAIIHLPRDVIGTEVRLADAGVLWRCEPNGLAMIRPVGKLPQVKMGGSGVDCLGNLVWYREIPESLPVEDAWLLTGVAEPSWLFDNQSVIRIPSGGFVRKQGDTVMHFPVEKVDLATGNTVRALLSVGFSPELSLPETNYSASTSPDGTRTTRTRGTYGAAITRIERDGDSLILTVASEVPSTLRVTVPAW